MIRSDRVDDAIIVDEVGIHTGRYGDYRLKTFYAPVFRRDGGLLAPCGVTGSTVPMIAYRPVAEDRFAAAVPESDRAHVEALGSTLALCNYENIGVDGLDLYVDLRAPGDAGRARQASGLVVDMLGALEIDRAGVVLRIARTQAVEPAVLRTYVEAMQRHGLRVALGGAGSNQGDFSRIVAAAPDIVGIDGRVIGRLAGEPQAARLLAAMVERLRGAGMVVQADGLDTTELLSAAVDAGADRLQGAVLAPPAMAGTEFACARLPVAALTNGGDNVALIGRRRAKEA